MIKKTTSTNFKKILKKLKKTLSTGKIKSLSDLGNYLENDLNLKKEDSLTIVEKIALENIEKKKYPIKRLELFLTENCNLACPYCFVEGKNSTNEMTEEIGKKAVDFLIAESFNAKKIHITFFGGEPLLKFPLIKKLTIYAQDCAQKKNKEIGFSITSNGTLFSEENLAFFKKYQIKILLSIDGDKETHNRSRITKNGQGSFDLVMKNLALLLQHQVWIGVRMTVISECVDKTLANVKFLAKQGVNQFIIGPATGSPWSLDKAKEFQEQIYGVYRWFKKLKPQEKKLLSFDFLEEIKKDDFFKKRGSWGCRAGVSTMSISANGFIYPCSKMLGLNNLEGICRMGNVNHGITQIKERKHIIWRINYRPTKCHSCPYSSCCSGGCFAVNFQDTKSMFKSSPQECLFSAMRAIVGKKIRKDWGLSYPDNIPDEITLDDKKRFGL